MENMSLNGTTNATKDKEWKKKKGYGPSLVAVSLTLLLSFYAGSHIVGGNLRHGEMGTTNAAASSSSSTSLVGSGTAASDLKTLTIVLDDDENIGVLLSRWLPKGSGGGANPGDKCEKTSDCAIPPGLDHGVCHDGTCKSGAPGSYCGVTSDCVKPTGLAHPVCRDGRCQSGSSGSSCGATSDCVKPTGLEHPVCRGGRCQRGVPGDSCGATSDCVKPQGLEHPVCRQGKCQAGVCHDYCGNDSDCLSPAICYGFTNLAKCQNVADFPELNARTPPTVRSRRDWITGSVVRGIVNPAPPDRFAESPMTVLSHQD